MNAIGKVSSGLNAGDAPVLNDPQDGLGHGALPADNLAMKAMKKWDDYLTTDEAANYFRRSKSFILTQPDLAYLPGHPNTYAKRDLDAWFERHKTKPIMR